MIEKKSCIHLGNILYKRLPFAFEPLIVQAQIGTLKMAPSKKILKHYHIKIKQKILAG